MANILKFFSVAAILFAVWFFSPWQTETRQAEAHAAEIKKQQEAQLLAAKKAQARPLPAAGYSRWPSF